MERHQLWIFSSYERGGSYWDKVYGKSADLSKDGETVLIKEGWAVGMKDEDGWVGVREDAQVVRTVIKISVLNRWGENEICFSWSDWVEMHYERNWLKIQKGNRDYTEILLKSQENQGLERKIKMNERSCLNNINLMEISNVKEKEGKTLNAG